MTKIERKICIRSLVKEMSVHFNIRRERDIIYPCHGHMLVSVGNNLGLSGCGRGMLTLIFFMVSCQADDGVMQ